MMIHEITEKAGRNRRRKRLGRGESSGLGKTAGRGHKGAASRSGWSLRPAYQGGQINFIQKLPKRGFNNAQFAIVYHVVNVRSLERIAQSGDEVTAETLAAAGVIRDARRPLKVLGDGELTKKLTVTAAKFSASARSKIEAAGGSVNEVAPKKWAPAVAADSRASRRAASGKSKKSAGAEEK